MSVQVTRLLVLGVVRLRQPTHGYDIQRELDSWNANRWASVTRPSVYNQLRKLTADGLLEVDSIEHTERRPSKIRYRLTPAGDMEFGRLLREVLWNEQPQPLDLLAALCFLPALTRAEAISAIEERARRVACFLDGFDEQMATWFPPDSPALYIREVFFLTQEAFLAELRWAEGLLGRLRAGEYGLSPT